MEPVFEDIFNGFFVQIEVIGVMWCANTWRGRHRHKPQFAIKNR